MVICHRFAGVRHGDDHDMAALRSAYRAKVEDGEGLAFIV